MYIEGAELAAGDSPRSRHDGCSIIVGCCMACRLDVDFNVLVGLIAFAELAYNRGSLISLEGFFRHSFIQSTPMVFKSSSACERRSKST